MSRKYFIREILYDDYIILENEEFHHIINVMRTKIGETLTFTDGKGKNCIATMEKIFNGKAFFKINETFYESDTPFELIVCVGLMKGDKNEFVIQKCSELGATKLCFFESEYCVVKSKDNKLERYNKISIEASKQCGRSTVMEILPTIKFNKLNELLSDCDKILCAYEKGGERLNFNELETSNKIAIIIGSEGGFSEKEISQISLLNQTKIVSLGKRILRAETAVLTLTSLTMYLKGEL